MFVVVLRTEGRRRSSSTQRSRREGVSPFPAPFVVAGRRGRRAAARAVVVVERLSGHPCGRCTDGRAGDFAATVSGLAVVVVV